MIQGDKDIVEPYVGPRPFRRSLEDRKRFFGRDKEAEEIEALILTHKLVLIYAQSGAGKTSLFNANIIPYLESEGYEVLPVARVGIRQSLSLEQSRSDTKDYVVQKR